MFAHDAFNPQTLPQPLSLYILKKPIYTVSVTCNGNYSNITQIEVSKGDSRFLKLMTIVSIGCFLCLIKIYLNVYAYNDASLGE